MLDEYGERIYVVEKLVKRRLASDQSDGNAPCYEYLVHWEGYLDAARRWKPADYIATSPTMRAMIDRFDAECDALEANAQTAPTTPTRARAAPASRSRKRARRNPAPQPQPQPQNPLQTQQEGGTA
jgi:hypothetical protein